jgi:hypothetical protein
MEDVTYVVSKVSVSDGTEDLQDYILDERTGDLTVIHHLNHPQHDVV